MISSVFQT